MRRLVPRPTTRRLIVAVAVVAVALDGSLQARRWSRLIEARRTLQRQQGFFEEGRLLGISVVKASRTLMEAELDLCMTTLARVAVVDRFLDRGDRLIDRIRSEEVANLEGGSRIGEEDLDVLAAMMADAQALRDRLLAESR